MLKVFLIRLFKKIFKYTFKGRKMNSNNLNLLKLPKNLQSLHEHEEKIHNKSVLRINTLPDLKEHLDIIYASLNMIFDITISYKNQTDDELTIQALGIRLFNSIASSLKLLLAGYYQNSVIFQRDILETGFLLDYFSVNPSKISDWRNSNIKQRLENYIPGIIRGELNKRDGVKKSKRDEIYKFMCERAAHPTFPGFDLIAPHSKGKIGPFFYLNFLIGLIKELAKWVPLYTYIYISHFKKLPSNLFKVKGEFLDELKTWAKKYINLDLSIIDNGKLKEWVDSKIIYKGR